jgi:tetraprenyl-beta-curcumene synthase
MSDSSPLSLRQLWNLLAAAGRELLWGLWVVAGEMAAWRCRALTIPDAATRRDALESLRSKRTHADGAGLFSILPRRRKLPLLRILVAYETVLDFLDNVHERLATWANGHQLHLAMREALDPDRFVSDYYREHLWQDDGGYLRVLVQASRECCGHLPSYSCVRNRLIGEGIRAEVLGVNHDPRPQRRDIRLMRWAEREYGYDPGASWFELTSAVSASLTVHALLALASEAPCRESDVRAVYAAYFPWISATSTMLDSYVDQSEDAASDSHVYVGHYGGTDCARSGVERLILRSVGGARTLRNPHRHSVIVACMMAMYLSKDSARTPEMRATTASLVRAGGPLTGLLVPVLRLWRIAYGQQSA